MKTFVAPPGPPSHGSGYLCMGIYVPAQRGAEKGQTLVSKIAETEHSGNLWVFLQEGIDLGAASPPQILGDPSLKAS